MKKLYFLMFGLILTILLSMGMMVTAQPESWRAWVLMPGGQWLMLIGESGDLYQVQRPLLPGEPTPNTEAQMVISRDGRYLLIATQVESGEQALGIFDLATETLINSFIAGAGEQFRFGWRYGDGQNIAGSSLIFSPDSQRAVVSLDHVETSAWRMWVIDLPSGVIVDQLHHGDLAGILSTANQQLIDASTMTNGFYFARPLYYDNNGGIHTQLILNFAGGAEAYPAFVWYPDQNIAQGSPYTRAGIDVYWQNGLALTTYLDNNVAALPQDGPAPSYNAVAQGTPAGDVLVLNTLYSDSNRYHYSAIWMDYGTRLAVMTDDVALNRQWAIVNPNANPPAQFLPSNYQYVHPVADGLLAVSEATEGYFITFIRDVADQQIIWNAPPMAGTPVILWAQMPGCGFGVEGNGECVLQTGDAGGGLGVVAPPDAPVYCEGAPPSINAVNTEARVTFTDGRPLNVRVRPGDTILTRLEEGETFTIIGGPECLDGYTWWQIRLRNGAQGWVAEGDADDYYVEPVSN